MEQHPNMKSATSKPKPYLNLEIFMSDFAFLLSINMSFCIPQLETEKSFSPESFKASSQREERGGESALRIIFGVLSPCD